MAVAAIFENDKSLIYPQPFDRYWQNLTQWRVLALLMTHNIKNRNFRHARWRTAAIFKIEKMPYLSKGSTDLDEILAEWCRFGLSNVSAVMSLNFWKPKMASATISRNRYIAISTQSLTDFDRIWRGDAHGYSGLYWTLKIALFKIQNDRRPPSWKNIKSPYLSTGLANRDQIWQVYADLVSHSLRNS